MSIGHLFSHSNLGKVWVDFGFYLKKPGLVFSLISKKDRKKNFENNFFNQNF